MFITDEKKQRALLVAVDNGSYDVQVSLEELDELTQTAGAEVVAKMVQNLNTINNATYIGSGKLLEVKDFCAAYDIDLVIFDDELGGAQIRNIEKEILTRVIDRTILILDIFAGRALSNEGKLQVELAQQKYLLPRLYGMGESLSRQGGGIGSRGPGETKLESDKRHIRKRIELLEKELGELASRRKRIRERRKKNDAITIAIVGYTNVGKSTLLNLLTDADVYTKDQLFATLDPTAREIKLNDGQVAVLIDTVGLIRRLPHQLVEAFKSTLEEAASADIILNICDCSSEYVETQLQVTNELLSSIGCDDIPVITVYNKIDKFETDYVASADQNNVFISAKKNIGMENLFNKIADVLKELMFECDLLIPYDKGSIIAQIRKSGKILSEDYLETGTKIHTIIDKKLLSGVSSFICAD
ncbi:MAG: GTPase HflX [Oscillospiraceae bacterium]